MPRRTAWLVPVLPLALLLGACSTPTTVAQIATPTATLMPTATVTAAPTTEAVTSTPFACPVTVAGSTATFDDPALSLRFTFPATWTEHDCVDMGTASDGTRSILVGNLFFVHVAPRNNLTVEQWVAKATDPAVEQVTLTHFSAPHAQDVVKLTVGSVPNAPRPPTQLRYVVTGTTRFYAINPLIAQMSMTDTIPQPYEQAIQQVVMGFDVP